MTIGYDKNDELIRVGYIVKSLVDFEDFKQGDILKVSDIRKDTSINKNLLDFEESEDYALYEFEVEIIKEEDNK
jgi:hypothetical protein